MKIVKKEGIDEISEKIKNGDIAIVPTDTVYGIAAVYDNISAIEKVYKVKKRNKSNPINLLVSNFDMADTVSKYVNATERKLMEAFWPGAFTIILDKKKTVPDILTANTEEIGVRMPNNKVILEIIDKVGKPLAVPSANISGKPSGTYIEDIAEDFKNTIEYALDDGPSKIGIESTIVKVIEDKVIILRPGTIEKKDIEELGLDCYYDEKLMQSSKLKHYKPKTKCILVDSDGKGVEYIKINEIIKQNKDKKYLVICNEKNLNKYKVQTLSFGKTNASISKNLFHIIRKADTYNADCIIIEAVKNKNIGIAIMNRLKKICESNIINI